MRSHRTGSVRALFFGLLSLMAVACDDGDASPRSPEGDGGTASIDAGALPPASGDAGAAKNGAILVAAFVRNPDGRNVYVGAVPEIPSGALDYKKFREFDSVDVTAYDGSVFVWDRDAANMTRFSVTDSLTLVEGPKLSLLNFAATGMVSTTFISPTRAYTMVRSLANVVVWNPQTMTITGTLAVPPHGRPADLETSVLDGHVVGDYVIWPISSENYDAVTTFPGTGVAIARAHTDEPVFFVNDTRCIGADGGHVDAKGDFYLRAGGNFGRYATFGPLAATAKTCTLRIKAGETAFDTSYLFDNKEVVGTSISWSSYHVKGSKYLGLFRDPATPVPAVAEYEDRGFKAFLYDIDAKTAAPYPFVEGGTMVSSIEFEVDGVSYYQLSSTGSVVNGTTDVVALREDGIEKKFSLPELWALKRIR